MEEIKNITIIDTLDLVKDFKEHLVEANKKPTYNYNVNCFSGARSYLPASDDRRVFFYEFSDTSRIPRKFEKVSEFLNWAKGANVWVSSYSENQLKTHEMNYVACIKGSSTIMVRHTHKELEMAIRNFGKSYYPYADANARNFYDGYEYDDWD